MLERRVVVREAAEPTRQTWMVEHQRHADEAYVCSDRALDGEGETPRRLAGCLDERARGRGRPDRRRVAGSEEGTGPTGDDRLRRRGDDDEVGLDEVPVDPRTVGPERHEVVGGSVVDDHAAVERSRLRRRQQALELAAPDTPAEPSCHEKRDARVVDAEAGELVEHRRERDRPRVGMRAGEGECGRLDDDRRSRAAPRRSTRAARPRAETPVRRARRRERR